MVTGQRRGRNKWSTPTINMVSICSSCLGNCCIAENFNVGAVEGKNGGEVMTCPYDLASRLVPATTWQAQVFTYTYDAAGNRLTQGINGSATTTYKYDAANRLIKAGSVTFNWDNNGNLLLDNLGTYAYDHANRPISITQGAKNYTFAYNGQGDRTRQVVNGVPPSMPGDGADCLTTRHAGRGQDQANAEDKIWLAKF